MIKYCVTVLLSEIMTETRTSVCLSRSDDVSVVWVRESICISRSGRSQLVWTRVNIFPWILLPPLGNLQNIVSNKFLGNLCPSYIWIDLHFFYFLIFFFCSFHFIVVVDFELMIVEKKRPISQWENQALALFDFKICFLLIFFINKYKKQTLKLKQGQTRPPVVLLRVFSHLSHLAQHHHHSAIVKLSISDHFHFNSGFVEIGLQCNDCIQYSLNYSLV